jgi:hypothetical protein
MAAALPMTFQRLVNLTVGGAHTFSFDKENKAAE